GVETIRGQVQQNIARADGAAGDHRISLHCAYDEAGEIVFSRLIQSRHFSGLAANQGAAVIAATTSHAFDNLPRYVSIQFSDRKIVEEKQRDSSLHGNIVDTVVHQILADGIVAAAQECDLQLGANAIGRANQNRPLPASQQISAAEAPD